MRLRDDSDVGDWNLERPDALLLRDEAGDGPVNLGGQEPLGAHGREAKDAVDGVGRGGTGGEVERRGGEIHALEVVRLFRHVAENLLEVEIFGNRRAGRRGGVHELDAAAAVDGPEHRERASLTRANLLHDRQTLRGDEHSRVLLVLGTPNLENGERGVAELDLADVELATLGVDELLAHVAVTSRALIVDG